VLLVAGSIGLLVSSAREPHWMYAKSFTEGSIWTTSGMLIAALSILLLLCGRDWWRGLLEVAAFIELYFWFSLLAWAVQMR
jgi:hypothetical protein